MSEPLRVLLIDDHPLFRRGLAQLIEDEPDLEVCGEAGSAPEGLEAARELAPDVVLVDLSLGEGSGLEVVRALAQRAPELPTLVVSMHEEALYAERCLRAGARGYVRKQEASETVLDALRQVLAGEVYTSPAVAQRLLRRVRGDVADAGPVDRLSDRELEVFQALGRGRGTREISEALHLSVKTVEGYRAQIKQKLGLESGAELVHHAVRWVVERGL